MVEENKQPGAEEVIKEEAKVKEPSKWTFLKYVKSIAHFKWWVIGFTLFGALAGYLGFRFILNPLKKTLSASYTYELAGSYTDDTETITLIDQTSFNPYDLTSRENLQKVKDSNEKYSSINLDKLITDNAIVISKTAKLLNEKDATSNVEINYVISAKSKYFKTDILGKEFLYDVIYLAKEISSNAIDNYKSDLKFTEGFTSLTFDRQISLVYDQYNYIFNSYETLMKTFSSSASGNQEGTKLNELQANFINEYVVSSVSSFTEILIGEKDANKYINYTIGKEDEKIAEIHKLCASYIQMIKNNKEKITVYEGLRDKLLSSTSIIGTDTNVSAQIAQYNNSIASIEFENVNINRELNNNGYFLNNSGEYVFDGSNMDTTIYKLIQKDPTWVNNNKSFKDSLEAYKELLINDNNELTSIYQYCYRQYKNKVNIQDGGYVNLDGNISNWLGLVAGLAAGFFVTSLITAAIYVYKEY